MKPKPRNKPPFLQQKTTGRVFAYTVELEQYRTDMVPFWGTQEEANAANERIRRSLSLPSLPRPLKCPPPSRIFCRPGRSDLPK